VTKIKLHVTNIRIVNEKRSSRYYIQLFKEIRLQKNNKILLQHKY